MAGEVVELSFATRSLVFVVGRPIPKLVPSKLKMGEVVTTPTESL
jgi:hypothetical protein